MSNPLNYEDKIWGRVAHLFNEHVAVSLLEVNAGFRCSVHQHIRRWNLFRVMSGRIDVVIYRAARGVVTSLFEAERHELRAGDEYEVPPCQWHTFHVVESGRVVEIYWAEDGGPISLDDIIRLDAGGPI